MLNYLEFKSEEEAEQWGEINFPHLVSDEFKKTEEYAALFRYGGGLYLPINRVLRGDDIDSNGLEELIEALKRIVLNNSLDENIITFRSVNIDVIQLLCGQKKLQEGMRFFDKAFLSTSLFKGSALEFGLEQGYNCILKLYLPQGTKGAYLSYKGTFSCLHEQEFLLAPETEFKIIKVHRFTKPKLIECKAVVK